MTKANINEAHLYITGHADFFPDDCFGASSVREGTGVSLRLDVLGLDEPVYTDIPTDSKSGRPRRFFRRRAWVRQFFARHCVKPGDVIAIERITAHRYKILPFKTAHNRSYDGTVSFDVPPRGAGPTVIELFAGGGGTALGFKLAGFRTLLANEWDQDACRTLRENVTDRVMNCAVQEIPRFPRADVVAGGPPCQGFSNLGEKVPNDPRNQLWRQFMRCVKDAQPSIFLLENVPPLLKSAEYVELKRLAELWGYQVDGRILNAADYGVPQARKRAFVIGSLVGAPRFPRQSHIDPSKKGLWSEGMPQWRTVRDAIGHLPPEPNGQNWHIGRNPTAKSRERYRCIPPGGNRWNLPLRLMPDCWKRKTKGGTDLFGRLWWDKPSVTIRTEFYKPEKGRYLHPVEHRPITHREAALLQGFPEAYAFCGSKINVGIQIGNAVPPPLAREIALEIKRSLARVRRRRSVG